jgi:hypothetical protein
MVLRAFGAGLLARLIGGDRDEGADTAWLLYGPTDEEVVEPEEDPAEWLAAE